eukprot:7145407-Pyramimonas_sp.AAC.2
MVRNIYASTILLHSLGESNTCMALGHTDSTSVVRSCADKRVGSTSLRTFSPLREWSRELLDRWWGNISCNFACARRTTPM